MCKKLDRKTDFYELNGEWDMHNADNLVMCLGDFNGHVCGHIDGSDGVRGGCGVGQRNLEVKMILEFYLEKESYMSKT